MKKIQLGICMEDEKYEDRLGKFLMNHYAEQMELFLYTQKEQLSGCEADRLDVLLLSDNPEILNYCCRLNHLAETIFISLAENKEHCPDREKKEEKEILYVDKYQNVNLIVDEIMRHVGTEVEEVLSGGRISGRSFPKAEIYAVYSLEKNEFQMPFAVTAGTVFGEKRDVLLMDLQENSGISQFLKQEAEMGLEDLMVMASLERFSEKRVRGCIGKMNQMDLIYPAKSSENICDAEKDTFIKIIHMVLQKMEYGTIIVNLGSRFTGFFEFLDQCDGIYLLTGQSAAGKWRQQEFLKEMEIQGYPLLKKKITAMEIPDAETQDISCEQLVRKWKWSGIGKRIRQNQPEGD